MWRVGVFLVLLCVACGYSASEKITVPNLKATFYEDAIDRIDRELNFRPDDLRLLDKKIYYCEELGWPVDCIASLEASRELSGMSNQLVERFISYHQTHDNHKQLIQILDRWRDEYNLRERYRSIYIEALIRSGAYLPAYDELRTLLMKNPSLDIHTFAANQYLQMQDTALATFYLSKVYREAPNHDLMWNYGKLLYAIGYPQKALDAINTYLTTHSLTRDQIMSYAFILKAVGNRYAAQSELDKIRSYDTVPYILVEWYKEAFLWDSAVYELDKLHRQDSSLKKPLWALGQLYEERGWLPTAYDYFQQLVEQDSTDTVAMERVDLIRRKIAYLQRQKAEEQTPRLLELKPKKIQFNE